MNPSDTVREVWDDFYTNDTATSEQLLRGLVSSKVARYDTFDYTEGLERKGEENNTIILEDIAEDIDEDVVGYFTEYIFSDGALTESTPIQVKRNSVPVGSFSPTPLYESCAPIPRNIRHGDDPGNVPYIPYADDSLFNVKAYTLEHAGIQWQECCHRLSANGIIIFLFTLLPGKFANWIQVCGFSLKSFVDWW